jgi:hypothetical protein
MKDRAGIIGTFLQERAGVPILTEISIVGERFERFSFAGVFAT